jgi:hypothetical protein
VNRQDSLASRPAPFCLRNQTPLVQSAALRYVRGNDLALLHLHEPIICFIARALQKRRYLGDAVNLQLGIGRELAEREESIDNLALLI